MQPQVFDLLVYLVENRHRVVSKDDLIATIWQGRIVSESTLTSRINAVRKAVGDSGESQTLIRTIARKGVRFVGDVRVVSAGEPAPVGGQSANDQAPPPEIVASRVAPPTGQLTPEAAVRQRTSRRPYLMLGGGLAAAMAALLGWQFTVSTGTPPASSRVEVAAEICLSRAVRLRSLYFPSPTSLPTPRRSSSRTELRRRLPRRLPAFRTCMWSRELRPSNSRVKTGTSRRSHKRYTRLTSLKGRCGGLAIRCA